MRRTSNTETSSLLGSVKPVDAIRLDGDAPAQEPLRQRDDGIPRIERPGPGELRTGGASPSRRGVDESQLQPRVPRLRLAVDGRAERAPCASFVPETEGDRSLDDEWTCGKRLEIRGALKPAIRKRGIPGPDARAGLLVPVREPRKHERRDRRGRER